jgi:hypothetical protein
MSNAFTNFLGGVVSGLFGDGDADMKDYQHADRLYVRNNYQRAPKFGFLYFVQFNINPGVIRNTEWLERGGRDVGLLVKNADLPKFTLSTETMNQYNRKSVVQTKITYTPVSFEFHDDNSDITTNLWTNYYQYYYMDSVYGSGNTDKVRVEQFGDTKYNDKAYAYGLDNIQTIPFFDSIDIYVLHQHKFTQYTLVNPMITEWAHDRLSQDEGTKIMSNKMTIAYESVHYNQGRIRKSTASGYFAETFYDRQQSPLRLGAGSLFGAGGVLDGAEAIFGEDGSLANATSPLALLGVALQTKQLVQGARNITKSSLAQEGYSILGGVLNNVAASGQRGLSQPGGLGSAIQGGLKQNGFGVNLFPNSSVSGTTQATPSKLTRGGGP